MRKTLVALCLILAVSLVCVGFAQEGTITTKGSSITPSTAPMAPADDSEQPPTAETLVNTGKEEHNNQETEPKVEVTDPTVSSSPMTIEDMAFMYFFDIELESAYAYAAQTENVIIKEVAGIVTLLAEHENGTHELQVSVPELNNDFCFHCVEPFAQQLGDAVTVYVVIQAPN